MILETLAAAYAAKVDDVEAGAAVAHDEPCPPRHGPGQNLAAMVDAGPEMAALSMHACSYVPQTPEAALRPGAATQPQTRTKPAVASADELVRRESGRVSAEIRRLRANMDHSTFAVFEASAAYVQCRPEPTPPVIYCEAVSAENAPSVAAALTPEHVAHLHALGFSDPGYAPNYWKSYPVDSADNTTIATELLTILHDVYGYDGATELVMKTD